MATLSQWRRRSRLTQKQLSALLELSLGAVVKYERGERMPELGSIEKIEKATRRAVTAQDLFRTHRDWQRRQKKRRAPEPVAGVQPAASQAPARAALSGPRSGHA